MSLIRARLDDTQEKITTLQSLVDHLDPEQTNNPDFQAHYQALSDAAGDLINSQQLLWQVHDDAAGSDHGELHDKFGKAVLLVEKLQQQIKLCLAKTAADTPSITLSSLRHLESIAKKYFSDNMHISELFGTKKKELDNYKEVLSEFLEDFEIPAVHVHAANPNKPSFRVKKLSEKDLLEKIQHLQNMIKDYNERQKWAANFVAANSDSSVANINQPGAMSELPKTYIDACQRTLQAIHKSIHQICHDVVNKHSSEKVRDAYEALDNTIPEDRTDKSITSLVEMAPNYFQKTLKAQFLDENTRSLLLLDYLANLALESKTPLERMLLSMIGGIHKAAMVQDFLNQDHTYHGLGNLFPKNEEELDVNEENPFAGMPMVSLMGMGPGSSALMSMMMGSRLPPRPLQPQSRPASSENPAATASVTPQDRAAFASLSGRANPNVSSGLRQGNHFAEQARRESARSAAASDNQPQQASGRRPRLGGGDDEKCNVM
jgi:hypothetical protein